MTAARSVLCRVSSGVLNRVNCHRSPRVQCQGLRSPFTQTLKTLVEKSPYFYQCCYSHVSSINTPKNVFFLTWFGHPGTRSSISSWVLQAPAAFIRDFLLFGSGDASCLSHLKNALTSTKLQSQVPECLAKPCPLLPWWDVLTATPPPSLRVSVALPHCRSGMRLISSSPPLCTSFVIRSSGFCKFICA